MFHDTFENYEVSACQVSYCCFGYQSFNVFMGSENGLPFPSISNAFFVAFVCGDTNSHSLN